MARKVRKSENSITCRLGGHDRAVCPLFDEERGCQKRKGGCYGAFLAQAMESPETLSLFLQAHGFQRVSGLPC